MHVCFLNDVCIGEIVEPDFNGGDARKLVKECDPRGGVAPDDLSEKFVLYPVSSRISEICL